MKIVISETGGQLSFSPEHSLELYNHLDDEKKSWLDEIQKKNPYTLSESIDLLFGNLSNKLRCNKWLVRLVEDHDKDYPHLFINDVPTKRFVIEYDRGGKEEFRSDENYDWENTEDWKEE